MISKIKDFVFINDEFFVFPLIEKIKTKDEYRRIFSNFLSLSVLQAANYILPLITLPYLVRVLGPEKFGLISFAQAFTAYFQIITDYGFNLSATREISINRQNKEKVFEIFSSVMFIKFGLLFVSLIFMSIIVFSFNKFREDWLIYYLTFGMVLGNTLFPIWFFQGLERMKYITFLNILAKLIFTVAIFVFVKQESNYLYVPLLNSIGFIIAGVLSLWIVFKDFKVEFKTADLKEIKYHLKEGWYIFISTLAISLYTVSNTFILGLFTNNVIVGYYSAAEKLIKAVQGILGPISQSVYPYVSKLINESKETGISFIKKLTFIIGSSSFVLSSIIFLFADLIVKIILGNQYIESIIVLRILAFLPFIIGLSNIFGIQTMVTLNYKKAFSNILVSASAINIILAFILVSLYKHIGISFSVLISEIFVTVAMFLFLESKGVKILRGQIV
jgi:PST family polysaccharide transporter